jgi:predicted negative regulator of RcsB-dependent stress response
MKENKTGDGVVITKGMKVWWRVSGKQFTVAIPSYLCHPSIVVIKRTRSMGCAHNLMFAASELYTTRANALEANWKYESARVDSAERQLKQFRVEEEEARVKAVRALKRAGIIRTFLPHKP